MGRVVLERARCASFRRSPHQGRFPGPVCPDHRTRYQTTSEQAPLPILRRIPRPTTGRASQGRRGPQGGKWPDHASKREAKGAARQGKREEETKVCSQANVGRRKGIQQVRTRFPCHLSESDENPRIDTDIYEEALDDFGKDEGDFM
jgi:hypothetical protein